MIAAGFFGSPLQGSTSDFNSAYRQVTAAPEQARYFVIAMWGPMSRRVTYGLAVSQLFGSGAAPYLFSRFPAWCVFVLGCAFAVLADHCVDDILVVEAAVSCFSAFSSWRSFAVSCG